MKERISRIPPLLTIVLVGIWLTVSSELSARQIALGAVISVMLVLAIGRLRPVRPRLRRLHLAVPLTLIVLADSARSNLAVARIVLGLARDRQVSSGFIDVPLDLTDPHGLMVLSVIVTATPGTSWAGLSPDGKHLKLHVLDLRDEQQYIRFIKRRYEQPLRRIFE